MLNCIMIIEENLVVHVNKREVVKDEVLEE